MDTSGPAASQGLPPGTFLGPMLAPGPGPAPLNVSAVPAVQPVQDQEVFASLSILLQILLLGLSFVVGHILRRRKFYYLHEASAALIIGLVAGTVANLANSEDSFKKYLNFREDFFMLFLLPPIIFVSGFSLEVKPFFSNFGAICVFALLGTLISALLVGILVYLGGLVYLMYRLPFLESLVFGAVISATDPVSVLAIFQELGADTNLYALVFGESVLNDAAAIVMYRTLTSIVLDPSGDHSILQAFQYAVVTFVGSLSIGVGVALTCALLFKYAGLAVRNLQNLECCLIVLFPYISYMVAEGYALSGIVAILFCGILMKRYTFPNLSEPAQTLAAGFFQLISSLAETFTFIYMGIDIALGEQQSWSHVSFILFSVIFIIVARVANVFPLAYVVNLLRPRSKQIPHSHQVALCYSGLRGAIAFALALQAVHDLPDGHGQAIFTATTVIVMLTVFVIGGSTAPMLESLGLAGEARKHEDETEDGSDGEQRRLTALEEEEDEESRGLTSPHEMLQRRLRLLSESTPSFSTLDNMYIRPFFTAKSEDLDLDQSHNGDGDRASIDGDADVEMSFNPRSSYKDNDSQRSRPSEPSNKRLDQGTRTGGQSGGGNPSQLGLKASQSLPTLHKSSGVESLGRRSFVDMWRQQATALRNGSNGGEEGPSPVRTTSSTNPREERSRRSPIRRGEENDRID